MSMPLTMDLRLRIVDLSQQGDLRVQLVHAHVVDPAHIEPTSLPHADVSPEETRLNGTPQYVAPLAEHTETSDLLREFKGKLEAKGMQVDFAYIDFENTSGGPARRDSLTPNIESVGMKDGYAV